MSSFIMEDDLFQNQNYQKKRIKDSLQQSDVQLKKIADHLEESCHSEVLIANQNQTVYQENDISQNTYNYQSQENELFVKNLNFKMRSNNQGVIQSGLSPIVQTQSLFTQEKEQTSLFNQSQADRNYDELLITFNDEHVKKSINQLKMIKDLKEKPVVHSSRNNLRKKDVKVNDSMRKSVLNKNVFVYAHIYKKLKQFFQNKTLSGRTQLLKNKQIQFYINDLSDVNNQTPQSQSYTVCMQVVNWITKQELNLIKDIPTFNPQNQIILSIKIIIFLLNSLFYTYLSLDLIFGAIINNIVFLVFFAFWGLEILIKLNTSIYIKNEHIQNRQAIFKCNYIRFSKGLKAYFTNSVFYQNPDLQRVINLDIEYFYQKNYKKLQEQNQTVLDKLSMNLKEQLLNEYYGSILNKVNCLKSNFSQETLYKVSLLMNEAYYLPNQVFLYEENYESNQLYYIIEGEGNLKIFLVLCSKLKSQQKVELSRKIQEGSNERQIISVLKKDEEFGHDSFFTGKANGFQAKAKTFTTVIKLSRESFQAIVKENDRDWQNFNQIKDNILNYNDQKHLKINCSVCQKIQHLTKDCPLLHFNRNDYLDKITYFERIKQNRIQQNRKKQKSQNSLLNQQIIEKFQQLFEQQNIAQVDDNNLIKSQYTTQSEINDFQDRSLSDLPNNEIQIQHDLYNREDKTPRITSQFLNISDSSSSNNNRGTLSQQKSLTSYPKVFKSFLDFEQEYNKQMSGTGEDQAKSPNISKREKELKNSYQKQDSFKDRSLIKRTNSWDYKTFSQYSKAVKSLLEHEQEVGREKEFKASIFSNQDSIKDRTPVKSMSKCNNIEFSLMAQNYHDSQYKTLQKLEGYEKQQSEIRQYPFSREGVLEKNQIQEKLSKNVQMSTYKSYDEPQMYQQIFENPWLFEKQKDFNYYFPEGNLQFVIAKYNRFQKRKNKLSQLKAKSPQLYKQTI
ncbi:hypothetical protein ABPG73_020947 [Tetrahymena malaccensis]